jgi:hypothetical protein
MGRELSFEHLSVEFFTDTVHNIRKSAERGRPIYDEVEKVRLRIAGDKNSVLVAPAHDQSSVRDAQTNARLTYAQLHHGPYEAFKAGRVFVGSGTPLSELPFLTEGKRRELTALNINTAEALAGLDGANLNRLGMGARELKVQAEAWLEKSGSGAVTSRLAAENEAMRARLEQLEAAMRDNRNSPAPEVAPITMSPFADWTEDTIRAWITEQGGEAPHHKCSHATLVAKADELNAAIAAKKKAA